MALPPEPPAPAPEQRRSILDRIRDAPKLAASLGAIVALIASTLALWRTIFPPSDSAEPTGGLGAILIDPGVSLREYLGDVGLGTEGYTAGALRTTGSVFTVPVDLEGQGLRVRLRWSMFDADSKTRLRDTAYNNAAGAKLSGKEGHRDVPIWIPAPNRAGTFYVRFELVDDKLGALKTRNSDPFRAAAPG